MSDLLIGVFPDDLVTAKIGGGEFDLSPMLSTVWVKLNTQLSLARTNAARRLIAKLRAEGINPDEVSPDAAKQAVDAKNPRMAKLTNLDMAVGNDPDYISDMTAVQTEAAIHSVVAMRNVKAKGGHDLPCTRAGDKLDAASAKFFLYNSEICIKLWNDIQKLNSLESEAKKA